jgi:hypothetical protein
MTDINTIREKLDLLEEFNCQKNLIEIKKRELLDEVKIPAEVEAIVSDGMKRMADVQAEIEAAEKATSDRIDAELAAAVIPDELREQLAEIERQRAAIVVPDELKAALAAIEQKRSEINAKKIANGKFILEKIVNRKRELQVEVEAQTKDVYDQVARRRQEIEAEFSGKADDVDVNIKKLEAEIKAAVKEAGESVKGQYIHAVYVRGRITWNTDKMEAWRKDHPFLDDARKEGEPSITLRRI